MNPAPPLPMASKFPAAPGRIALLAWFLPVLLASAVRANETAARPPLTLPEAHALALARHPRLAAAGYQQFAAEQAVRAARAATLPSVNLAVTAAGAASSDTRLMAGAINNPSVFDRAAEGIVVNQLLTDFGRTGDLTASARLHAEAEERNVAVERQQVLLQVDISFYATLGAQAVQEVAREILETRQRLLDQVAALAANQLKSELDLSFARVGVSEARLLLERAESDAEAAEATLAAALGSRDFPHYQLVETPAAGGGVTNDVASLVRAALTQRPDLQRLRYEQESAQRFAHAEHGLRHPVVSAVGTVGNAPIHDDRLPDNYAAAALTLTLPLYTGGLYRARQEAADWKAAAVVKQLEAEEANVIRDVRIAALAQAHAVESLRTAEELTTQAREAYRLAGARYAEGLSSIVELGQAQLSLTAAEFGRARARYELLVRGSLLAYQTGSLD